MRRRLRIERTDGEALRGRHGGGHGSGGAGMALHPCCCVPGIDLCITRGGYVSPAVVIYLLRWLYITRGGYISPTVVICHPRACITRVLMYHPRWSYITRGVIAWVYLLVARNRGKSDDSTPRAHGGFQLLIVRAGAQLAINNDHLSYLFLGSAGSVFQRVLPQGHAPCITAAAAAAAAAEAGAARSLSQAYPLTALGLHPHFGGNPLGS